jgi:8-oxo-dGTP diphosphatase
MKFPCGKVGRQMLEFYEAPFRPPLRAFAALVFPWRCDELLICNIEDRGWCIPSGRVEPHEDSQTAGRREAQEEAGAVLGPLIYIGAYKIKERTEVRWAEAYTAEVLSLTDLDPQFESTGRQFVKREDLEEIYYCWNELTEMVFDHSKARLERHQSLFCD